MVIGVVALLAAGTAGLLTIATSGPGTPPEPRDTAAIKAVLTRAEVFLVNLGAPRPVGVSSSTWSDPGDPLRLGAGGQKRLRYPERSWMSPSGHVIELTGAEAAAIASTGRRVASTLFTGALLAEQDRELATVIAGERGGSPTISSPGGARILRWLSVTGDDREAQAEAVVESWDLEDTFTPTATGAPGPISSTIGISEIDARAKLVRTATGWRLVALDQLPQQQPT